MLLANIQQALNNATPAPIPAIVTAVTGSTTQFDVTFTGSLANADQPTLRLAASALTGGISPTVMPIVSAEGGGALVGQDQGTIVVDATNGFGTDPVTFTAATVVTRGGIGTQVLANAAH